MARKKTRKQKKKTQKKRRSGEITPQGMPALKLDDELLQEDSPSTTPKKAKKINKDIYYSYDPKLIIADLKRTILFSAVIFGIQIALFISKQQGYLDTLFN